MDRSTLETQGTGTSTMYNSLNPDAWAIKFIDLTWLQPISEAFDDDASGFITTTEVNRFTSSRPADWSLPHWLAFWAVGFRTSIIDYAQKIEDLFAKMEGIRAEVLPANQELMDIYFTDVWKRVHRLTDAAPSPLSLSFDPEKFKPYLEAEEARLSTNLKAVNYFIDGTDTLSLITGLGRIEKTVFPLLYLLMKRHYEIMRIMRTKIIDLREICESAQSICSVYDAISYRVDDLNNYFSHQRMDGGKQFQSFAYGIFKNFHASAAWFSPDYVRSLCHPVTPYDDDNEDQNIDPKHILNYGSKDDQVLDYWVYDGHSIDDIADYGNVEPPLVDILGHWHGNFCNGEGDQLRDQSIMTIVLEPGDGEQDIKGDAWSCQGRFMISGSWSKGENDIIEVKFKISSFDTAYLHPVYLDCRLDSQRDALTGVWGMSELDTSMGQVEFRRIPPRHFVAYPNAKALRDNKPRAFWKFAIAAVRDDILREHWPWSYFSQRRLDRITRISLTIRHNHFGVPLDEEEIDRLGAATRRLTSADACFYGSIVNHIRASTWVHKNAFCDSCGGWIGGARLFGLDCIHKTTEDFGDIDICCQPQCVIARIIIPRNDIEGVHEPTHRLVKARIPVLTRTYGSVFSAALRAYGRIQYSCARIAESTAHPQEGEIAPNERKTSDNDPIVSGTPANIDKVDDSLTTQDETRGGAEAEDGSSQAPTQVQVQDKDLPTCGNCKGRLSFPCWFCIFCEDDLFICDVCDSAGVPDLMRSSGRHVEGHHLIRCQALEEGGDTSSPTEQRLSSVEGRLDGMKTQLDDLTYRMGDLHGRVEDLTSGMGDLNSRVGDLTGGMGEFNSRVVDLTGGTGNLNGLIGELTGSIASLTDRIADIEQLLHRLVGTANNADAV